MKPTYTLLPDFITVQRPFLVREIMRPNFATDFHFHDECQLVYIVSGSGTRIIGNSIETYDKGDLTFVGPNVPHVWYSKANENEINNNAISIALYINPTMVTDSLKTFLDTKSLSLFFQESERGLKIVNAKKEKIIVLLKAMVNQKELTLLSSFMKICSYLIDNDDFEWLNEASLLKNYSNKNRNRFSKLMQYIQQNFRTEITLQKAASVADMQLHSFCRYFKSLTHHTFSDFVNEIRIDFACKLLNQSDLPITQVAFESGFSNISYFNRSFKKIHGKTPREFRQQLVL
jgi:AraC-like DNA-binding protein